eukprot:scaffold3961_cov127-Skeletonema_marinoi.AAC.9
MLLPAIALNVVTSAKDPTKRASKQAKPQAKHAVQLICNNDDPPPCLLYLYQPPLQARII